MTLSKLLCSAVVVGGLLIVLPASQLPAKDKPMRKGMARAGLQMLPTAAARSLAADSSVVPPADSPKAILILQTRNHRLTVYGSEHTSRYSVATSEGLALADQLTATQLQDRFPELHEILTGVAWAGM